MIAHLRYLRYVIRHKWFVLVAGIKVRAPFWRLLIHDWSKFTPAEWWPYVEYFYTDRKSSEALDGISEFGCVEAAPFGFYVKDRFNVAWLHHQRRNKHHWQYWVLTEDSGKTFPLPMPYPLAREMVADWMGAGRAITGRWEVAEWYAKNRETIHLHPDTRRYVEDVLGVKCGYRATRTEGSAA